MKKILRTAALAAPIAGSVVLAIGALCYLAGARVNTSRSIPVGLYWTSDRPVERGEYVVLCPPQVGVVAEALRRGYLSAGFCPGGYGFMMKKVAALASDAVDIGNAGVAVNGALLPLSAPLPADAAGRPMPRYQAAHFIIGNSEALLMSDVSATSFDGRYIGPVNRAQIEAVIVPVLVWRDHRQPPPALSGAAP